MKKAKYILLLLAIFILIAILIGILITKNRNSIKQNNTNQNLNTQDSVNVYNVIRDTIPSNWKTYSNNMLPFTFQYPSNWTKNGKEANVIDLTGTLNEIDINFADTISQTYLSIEYHFAPKGAELYQYALSQYNSSQGLYANGGKLIEVAGNKAIEAFIALSKDGKGHALNPPSRLIIIVFPDKQQTGEIKLQFETPLLDDDIEVVKFNRLLTTFKFTN